MLTKFETRSPRVKSVSFHSKRPWVLCGLHNGVVQIWDYRMSTQVDKFEEHEGPVRGVDFHVNQPLFATGADDYRIKLWNFKLRRCVATFLGHLDYIRQVQFHREQPWLVSASDDQTLRIWNWQSRTAISVLTGHNHYVMSAQFHPRDDLIVSASLDLTIRVWDISGLRAKKGQDSSIALPQDLFGSNDVVVKFILEGHEKGVNWAAFHPTKPFIVSGADDRSIRIWKMDDTRTYEIEQLRGHTNNVSCVSYFKDYVVSVSEDRTIRVWDTSLRTAIQTFRKDNDRFWVLSTHPEVNLLAAGHDAGLIVFKLERERPAFTIQDGTLYWVNERPWTKERLLKTYEFATKAETSPLSLRRHTYPPHSLSCNPADNMAVLWYDYDGGIFELFTIPKRGALVDAEVKKGFYASAVFFSANKFAVLDKTRQVVLRTTSNDITKVLPPVGDSDRLFPAPQGLILCRADEKVYLFHVAQRSVVAECAVSKAKYVVWSHDFNRVALQSKHLIVIANRKLKILHTIHESTRIKSCAFDEEQDVVYYATSNHLKYCSIRSGETGTLKTLESPIYLVRAVGEKIWFITRDGKVVQQDVDNTELAFKLALQQERFRDVLKLIQSRKIQGQVLVAYLHKHGFPEIAMHFVTDPHLRFNLAIECGTLDVANACAQQINSPDCWRKLAETAPKYGDIQLAQFANAKLQNFNGLGLQCIVTGNLAALSQVITKSKDENFQMHYSLFTEEVEGRINSLKGSGNLPLAYSLAVTNGLDEVANALLEEMKPEVAERCRRMRLPPATAAPEVDPVTDNWPMLPVAESYFSRMLKEPGALDYTEAVSEIPKGGGWGDDEDELDLEGGAAADGAEDAAEADADLGGGQWDDDLEIDSALLPPISEPQAKAGGFVLPREGESVHKHWVDTSNWPVYHVAAGSFLTALQLLQRQIGLVDSTPLMPQFMQIWTACNGAMPTVSHFPAHMYAATTQPPVDISSKHAPLLPKSLAMLTDRIKQGYEATTNAKFADALRIFQSVLHQVLLSVVDTQQEINELRDILGIAREYVMALNVEVKRKETTNATNIVEYAAYFTHFKLQPAHLILSLGQAMSQAIKIKNYKTAGGLARRLLDLDPPQERAEKARRVVQTAEANPVDAVKLDYDDRNPFALCCVSKRPMYRGTVEVIRCSYCYAPAHPSYKDEKCPVCLIARLGGEASGMAIALRNH